MLRKFSLVAVAATLLGAAALAPTSASAHEYGGRHHGWGWWSGPVYYDHDHDYGYDYDHDYDHYRHCPPRWRPF
jgi:hypothetical protein